MGACFDVFGGGFEIIFPQISQNERRFYLLTISENQRNLQETKSSPLQSQTIAHHTHRTQCHRRSGKHRAQ